jgi:hypothetical protein
MVEVPAPGAAMLLGVNVTVCWLPCPEAVKVTAELNPPAIVVVIVEVPELPRATVIAVGEALTVKLGEVPVTVNETAVVAVVLPEVPFTVMV